MQTPIDDPLAGAERSLTALRSLAHDPTDRGASPAVEARLMAEVRAIARARRITHIKSWSYAATLALLVALPAWHIVTREPQLAATEELTTEFFPLRYGHVPLSRGHLVRMEVPESAMESFGLTPAGGAAATVLADVLVGEDGVARAVRFVVTTSEETLR
jgi:hypothetical protein